MSHEPPVPVCRRSMGVIALLMCLVTTLSALVLLNSFNVQQNTTTAAHPAVAEAPPQEHRLIATVHPPSPLSATLAPTPAPAQIDERAVLESYRDVSLESLCGQVNRATANNPAINGLDERYCLRAKDGVDTDNIARCTLSLNVLSELTKPAANKVLTQGNVVAACRSYGELEWLIHEGQDKLTEESRY